MNELVNWAIAEDEKLDALYDEISMIEYKIERLIDVTRRQGSGRIYDLAKQAIERHEARIEELQDKIESML